MVLPMVVLVGKHQASLEAFHFDKDNPKVAQHPGEARRALKENRVGTQAFLE